MAKAKSKGGYPTVSADQDDQWRIEDALRTLQRAGEIVRDAAQGSVILAMLPDTGERYLSTFLFEGVNEGTDVELADL